MGWGRGVLGPGRLREAAGCPPWACELRGACALCVSAALRFCVGSLRAQESAAEVRAAPQAAGAAASKAGVYGGSGGDAVAGGDGGLGRWLNRTLDMPPLKPTQPAAARL